MWNHTQFYDSAWKPSIGISLRIESPWEFYMMIQSNYFCSDFHALGRTVSVQIWAGTSKSHSLWKKGKYAMHSRAKLDALLLNVFTSDWNLFKEIFMSPGKWNILVFSLINILKFFFIFYSFALVIWDIFMKSLSLTLLYLHFGAQWSKHNSHGY